MTMRQSGFPRIPPPGMTSSPFIEIDHVTFGYDSRRTILNDLSLQFARGKVTAVWGLRLWQDHSAAADWWSASRQQRSGGVRRRGHQHA